MSRLSCSVGQNGEDYIKQKFGLLDPPDIRGEIYVKKNWDAISPLEDKLVSIKTTNRSLKNGLVRQTHFSDYSPRLSTSEDFFLVLNHALSDHVEVYLIQKNWFLSLFSQEAAKEFEDVKDEWRVTGKNLDRSFDPEWKRIQTYLKKKYYNEFLKFSIKKDHQGQIRCQCYPSNEGLAYIRQHFRVDSLNGKRLI